MALWLFVYDDDNNNNIPVEYRDGVDSFQSATRGHEVCTVSAVTLDVKCTVGMSILNDGNEAGPVACQVVHSDPITSLHTHSNHPRTFIKHRLQLSSSSACSLCTGILDSAQPNCRFVQFQLNRVFEFWISLISSGYI